MYEHRLAEGFAFFRAYPAGRNPPGFGRIDPCDALPGIPGTEPSDVGDLSVT